MHIAKLIGTDWAGISLIVAAGVGISAMFGALILVVARKPWLREQLFNYVVLVFFVFSEATGGLLALMLPFPLGKLKYLLNNNNSIIEWVYCSPPKPHAFVSLPVQSGVFYHLGENMEKPHTVIVSGKGNYLHTIDGQKIFDASGGAAVSCLGHGNLRINKKIAAQLKSGIPYASSTFWSNLPAEQLSKALILSTNGKMCKVYLCSSGSESTEAGIKASLDYHFIQNGNTYRHIIIFRDRSYHGNTLGALSISGFASRKEPYVPLLMNQVYSVSSCYPYRQRYEGESDTAFNDRKARELEALILKLGPEKVSTFIAEPVVGAALGCVPFVPGYLKAMQTVCRKYGVLFMVDEVMCGMGRTGTLHAWQAEPGFTPDIQTMGKGLGAGYQPIGAMMISKDIFKAFSKSGRFVHGQTYEGMPVQAVAALEVLTIIQEKNLLLNVRNKGLYLEQRLRSLLGDHPNVGDIRGKGLFWGIEFVIDKFTKKPFNPKLNVAPRLQKLAISSPYNMTIYQSTGCVDGISGDIIMLAPSFMVTYKDIDHIVDVLSRVINKTFENIDNK